MTSAVIVGSRGSGLTTFVGLLYTAQVRLATEGNDAFRFHAGRETLRRMDSIYADLGAGRFPAREVEWTEEPLSFLLSFPSRGWGLWSGRSRHKEGSTVQVTVGGISTEELAEHRDHEVALEAGISRLLPSPVILALIDASRWSTSPKPTSTSPEPDDDRLLAASGEVLTRYLAVDPDRKGRVLHLLFVLTKLDRCPGAARAEVGLSLGSSGGVGPSERSSLGARILARYLPHTQGWLTETVERRAVSVAPPRWYFSSLRVDPVSDPPRIARRLRAPGGGWEPEYPYEEYRGLIEHLGELAHRLPESGPR